MFGSELWWKGEATHGTIGRANDIQKLVNEQARAVIGCFRTTNLGTLEMETGFRPAATQLENRQREYGLRLLSLPQGSQARKVVGAVSAFGKRLESALGYSGRTETTVLLEDPEAFDAVTI
jgi:hypothetical protein